MTGPPKKSIFIEKRHPVRRYSQKCVHQSLARKVKKGKNNAVEHYISPCWADLYHFWHVGSDY